MMIPNSIEELFDNYEEDYTLIDYYDTPPMDNIESMDYFLDEMGILEEYIETNEGTYVVLSNENYPFKLKIESSGLGDFYSHLWTVRIFKV